VLIEEERQRVLPPPGDDLAQYVACAGGREE